MGITTKSIGKAYNSVKVFNSVAGNLANVDAGSIDNQISFIFSELEETITGFETKDAVELVDGACDLFVTVAGLMQKLEAAGFDVDEALRRVNQNNMSKYPVASANIAVLAGAHSITLNSKHGVWVIKNATGKIMKPSNFEPVYLDDTVAEGFFKVEKTIAPVQHGWFATLTGVLK